MLLIYLLFFFFWRKTCHSSSFIRFHGFRFLLFFSKLSTFDYALLSTSVYLEISFRIALTKVTIQRFVFISTSVFYCSMSIFKLLSSRYTCFCMPRYSAYRSSYLLHSDSLHTILFCIGLPCFSLGVSSLKENYFCKFSLSHSQSPPSSLYTGLLLLHEPWSLFF